jgi:hypothetical protein
MQLHQGCVDWDVRTICMQIVHAGQHDMIPCILLFMLEILTSVRARLFLKMQHNRANSLECANPNHFKGLFT